MRRPKAPAPGSSSAASPYSGATPAVPERKKSIPRASPRAPVAAGEIRQEKSLPSPRASTAGGEVRQKKKSVLSPRPSSAASDASHASPGPKSAAAPAATSAKPKPKSRNSATAVAPPRKRISQLTVTEMVQDDFDAGIQVSTPADVLNDTSNSEDETITSRCDGIPSVTKENARREAEQKAKREVEENVKRGEQAGAKDKDKPTIEVDDMWKDDPLLKANILAVAKEEAEAEAEARQVALREEEARQAAAAHYASCQGHAPVGGQALSDSASEFLAELKDTFPDAPEALLERASLAQSIDEAMDLVMAEL